MNLDLQGQNLPSCRLNDPPVVQVAHVGIEPTVSSLRTRCPKPLDECAAGAAARDRTWDLRFKRPLLYQLSYGGTSGQGRG